MLPSTGYFKTIACPFYEDGSCDRPYCHFKHARRVPITEESTSTPASTSTSTESSQILQKNATVNVPSTVATGTADTLSQLVTEAVKKVLAEQKVTDKEEISQTIVSKVVEGLKPTLAGSLQSSAVPLETPVPPSLPITNTSSCTYNPTPISELKKRHISIPIYNPVRESRVTVKRKGSPDERTRSWQSILLKNDDNDDTTYKPTPVSGVNDSVPVPGYVPTAKSTSASTPVSYDPSAIDTYVPKSKEAYYPKPKKRREEYVPRKVKRPFNNVGLNEYDMMDEVICMNAMNQDSNSQDFMDIEPRFSDDDDENFTEKKELIEPKTQVVEEEDEEEDNKKIEKEEESKQVKEETSEKDNDKIKKSSSKNRHSSSSTDRKSSKTEEQVNGNKHKSTEKDQKESKKKDDKKRSSSSTSKHDDKTKHSSKSSSSSSKHSSSKESSKKKDSSRDKDKDKKDKEKKDSSKHESHKSKKSSKSSDKESTSDKDRHKKKSSSSSSSKEAKKDDKSKDRKKSSDTSKHSDKSSKSSKKDKDSHKSSSIKKEKEEIDEKLFLSEKDLFDDSDVDIEEECYKIFQEYEESDQPKPTKVSCPGKQNVEDVDEEVGKKRVAHASAESSLIRKPGPSQPVKKQPNPQQKLYERWRMMKEAAAEKAAAKLHPKLEETSPSVPDKSPQNSRLQPQSSSHDTTHTFNGNGKIRIAHVPYAMTLALAKKQQAVEKLKEIESRTPAQNIKNKSRVAHIPQVVPQLIRPEPLEAATQKFSLNVRQHYVNMMHDVCIQIYNNGDDAVQRALTEEFTCYERCKALNVYKNSCMLAVHRLKKEVEQEKSDLSLPLVNKMVSHEAVLAGKSKGSWSVVRPKKIVTNFKGSALYNMLSKWIMVEQQLKDNGYPRPHPDGQKGHAKVYNIDNRSHSILSKIPNERTCARCGQTYMVDKKGFAVRQQNCIYHWGRKFSIRGEGRYSCCQQYGSASGCADATTHVWDYVDYENLRGYVKTLPKDLPDDEQGVYSLDCEMCYTTQGLELTRVTVINEDCQVVYETLVKPENQIIDYNTRFSGITEEIMRNVTTTILDVQATLLTMFSSKTILVGHSLESDFKALKLIHDTVVDTSVMFPHRNGHPHKRALKNLCSEYLRKIIQNDVGGHDSNEDAVACMELVLWKVKEEAKLQ